MHRERKKNFLPLFGGIEMLCIFWLVYLATREKKRCFNIRQLSSYIRFKQYVLYPIVEHYIRFKHYVLYPIAKHYILYPSIATSKVVLFRASPKTTSRFFFKYHTSSRNKHCYLSYVPASLLLTDISLHEYNLDCFTWDSLNIEYNTLRKS